MRCKLGDITIVIGSIANNLGRLVVISGAGTRFDGSASWKVRCVGYRKLGGRRSADAPIVPCDWVMFTDRQLQPIPGVALNPMALLARMRDDPLFAQDKKDDVQSVEAGVGIEPA